MTPRDLAEALFEDAAQHTSWHLTDDPHFALDSKRRPVNNTTLGGEWPEAGMFVDKDPEHWFNGYDYVRPFVAEIEHPPLKGFGGSGPSSGEKFLPASAFSKSRVKRVIPWDEYCREHFGEYGHFETFHGTDVEGKPIPSSPTHVHKELKNYSYAGPDVRDMSPDIVKRHQDRATAYIQKVRPWILAEALFDDAPVSPITQQLRGGGTRTVGCVCDREDCDHPRWMCGARIPQPKHRERGRPSYAKQLCAPCNAKDVGVAPVDAKVLKFGEGWLSGRDLNSPDYWQWRKERAGPQDDVYWHGSASGGFGPAGTAGHHVGTRQAAQEALVARIGQPAEGEWDGTREYGKTKLAGRRTLARQAAQAVTGLDPNKDRCPFVSQGTGHNCGDDLPEDDYYPHERPTQLATYGNGARVQPDAKPDIFPVRIVGPMTNRPWSPHPDFKVQGWMAGHLKRGHAKSGYYYRNEGEDEGSISAVVPSASHLERLDKAAMKAEALAARLFGEDVRVIPGTDEPDEMEPGTRPLPSPDHVRFFHYTQSDDDLDSIARGGILYSRARGHVYAEPDAVWAAAGNATNHPQVRDGEKPFVEFALHPADPRLQGSIGGIDNWKVKRGEWTPAHSRELEARNSHTAIPADIRPEDIIAIHKSWHGHARYTMKNPEVVADFKAGLHDWMPGDRHYQDVHGWMTRRYGPVGEALPPRTPDTMSDAIAMSSPSGRMSKRAKDAAAKRLATALFGPGGLQRGSVPQPPEHERLRAQADRLADLAARGMSVAKFTKEAARLRAQADALERGLGEADIRDTMGMRPGDNPPTYGVRTCACRHPERHRVGDVAPRSRTWRDNQVVAFQWEPGTSATELMQAIPASGFMRKKGHAGISHAVTGTFSDNEYHGDHMLLLGSHSINPGEDPNEIVMRDARVLDVARTWEPEPRRKKEAKSDDLDGALGGYVDRMSPKAFAEHPKSLGAYVTPSGRMYGFDRDLPHDGFLQHSRVLDMAGIDAFPSRNLVRVAVQRAAYGDIDRFYVSSQHAWPTPEQHAVVKEIAHRAKRRAGNFIWSCEHGELGQEEDHANGEDLASYEAHHGLQKVR